MTGINADAPPPPPPPTVGGPCNADVDCAPLTAENWRCEQHTAPPAADNNCHIPGPGTKGNNTCACTVQRELPPAALEPALAAAGQSIQLNMLTRLTACTQRVRTRRKRHTTPRQPRNTS